MVSLGGVDRDDDDLEGRKNFGSHDLVSLESSIVLRKLYSEAVRCVLSIHWKDKR